MPTQRLLTTWPINLPQTIGSNTALSVYRRDRRLQLQPKNRDVDVHQQPSQLPDSTGSDFTMKADSASVTVAAGAQSTSTIMVAPSTGANFATPWR